MPKSREPRWVTLDVMEAELRRVYPGAAERLRIENFKTVAGPEAEKADCVVCILASDPTPFTDNVLTYCADCIAPIQHRPTAPKRPKKICIRCAQISVLALASKPPDTCAK